MATLPTILIVDDEVRSLESLARTAVAQRYLDKVNRILGQEEMRTRFAALNMAGQAARMKGVLAINVLDSMGMISSSFGEWQGVAGGGRRH